MAVMELRLTPELEAKLGRWSAETGCSAGELVEEALAGYLDELATVRGMLDGRYDELKSSRVHRGSRGTEPATGDQQDTPYRTAGVTSRYVLHPEAVRDLEEVWEYIAQDSLDAADRVIGEVFAALDMLVASPHAGHRRDAPREAIAAGSA